MASTGLLGINPYRGGNVAIDITSKPTQLAINLMQKQQAKAEAVDKYFKDYEKSLNTAGLGKSEIDVFAKKLREVQEYGIKNKQAINNPSKYGYDAQSSLMAGFKDLQSFIDQSKQATAERKALVDFHNQNIKSGKHVSANYMKIYEDAMKPVGEGYVTPDYSQIDVYDPFDDKKFQSSITSNVTPMIKGESEVILDPTTKKDTGFSIKRKKSIYDNDKLKEIAENSLTDFKTKKGTEEYFIELSKDPELVKKLNPIFGEVYKTVDPVTKKEIIPTIKSIEDFARAVGISKIEKDRIIEVSAPELNDEGKFRNWLRQHNISAADDKSNTSELLKALAMQGSQQIFNKAMAGYRTNEAFSDNKDFKRLNLPKNYVDPYIDEDFALGPQQKLKNIGLPYQKTKLVPEFAEDNNGNIVYVYPKVDANNRILTGQYDWKNAKNVTYDLQNKIASSTAGSPRESAIIGLKTVGKRKAY
jgi:hypothetical protein